MRCQPRYLISVASLAFLVLWGLSRLEPVRGADEPARQDKGPEDRRPSPGQARVRRHGPRPLSRSR